MSTSLYEEHGLIANEPPSVPPLDNTQFVFFIGLALDAVLFITFAGGFFLLRASAASWPPPDLPHLHRSLVGMSSLCLFLAAALLTVTVAAQNRNALRMMRATLMLALLFLAGFLILNGIEWRSIFANGLPIRTIFGGIYFVLTGVFHVHIAGSMIYIVSKYRWTLRWRRYTRSAVSIARLSYFVDAMFLLWLGIYGVIYL
jgi:cytochrome c oxidase subunit III